MEFQTWLPVFADSGFLSLNWVTVYAGLLGLISGFLLLAYMQAISGNNYLDESVIGDAFLFEISIALFFITLLNIYAILSTSASIVRFYYSLIAVVVVQILAARKMLAGLGYFVLILGAVILVSMIVLPIFAMVFPRLGAPLISFFENIAGKLKVDLTLYNRHSRDFGMVLFILSLIGFIFFAPMVLLQASFQGKEVVNIIDNLFQKGFPLGRNNYSSSIDFRWVLMEVLMALKRVWFVFKFLIWVFIVVLLVSDILDYFGVPFLESSGIVYYLFKNSIAPFFLLIWSAAQIGLTLKGSMSSLLAIKDEGEDDFIEVIMKPIYSQRITVGGYLNILVWIVSGTIVFTVLTLSQDLGDISGAILINSNEFSTGLSTLVEFTTFGRFSFYFIWAIGLLVGILFEIIKVIRLRVFA